MASQNVVEAVAELGSACYREREELRAELSVVHAQCESLREALALVLDTREKEAKAWFSSNNAKENFSDRGVKEEREHLAAMIAASNAEKGARLLLATLKTPNAEVTGLGRNRSSDE